MFVEKNWRYKKPTEMDPIKVYFELLEDLDTTDNLAKWIIDDTFQLDDVWDSLEIFRHVIDTCPKNINLEACSSSEFIMLYAKSCFENGEFAETNTTSRFNINLIGRTIKKLDLECATKIEKLKSQFDERMLVDPEFRNWLYTHDGVDDSLGFAESCVRFGIDFGDVKKLFNQSCSCSSKDDTPTLTLGNHETIIEDIFEYPDTAYDSILKFKSSDYMDLYSPGLNILTIGDYKIAIIDNMTDWSDSESSFEETITNVIMSRNITEIPDEAFLCMDLLNSVIIPDSVTRIGALAFSNCSSLTSIIIPESVTSVGDSAFTHCSALESMVVSDTLWNYGNPSFIDCSSGKPDILLWMEKNRLAGR